MAFRKSNSRMPFPPQLLISGYLFKTDENYYITRIFKMQEFFKVFD